MKRVFLIIVIAMAIFAAESCKVSDRSKQERLDADHRQFRKTFDEEMKR